MQKRSGDEIAPEDKRSSLGPLDRLDRLAGGFDEDAELACEDCGATDDFVPVAPGDLRHGPCWMAHVERGHVKSVTR